MGKTSDKVISLFSGAGGLSAGFAMAGSKPVAGVELDPDARATYEANLHVPCHDLDLGGVSLATLRSTIGLDSELFAIIGGPPCQGFSSAGARESDDPRNKLIFNYLHIVAGLRPRWFLFENVEGLLTASDGQSIFQLALEFIRLGYWIRIEKVNFAGFGIPQSRKRVIVVGNRIGFDFAFPLQTHSFHSGKHYSVGRLPKSPTLGEALAGLGEASSTPNARSPYVSNAPRNTYDERMRVGNREVSVSLHNCPRISESDYARIMQLKPGQTMKDLPEHLWHESFRRRAFRRVADGTPTERRGGAPSGLKRLRADLNSLTITSAATREFIHPVHDRPLTLRECARLQSFEDRVEFVGNAASVATQIGNAVPPLAAEVLAQAMMVIDGSIGSGKLAPMRRAPPTLLGFHLSVAEGMSPALARTHALLSSLVDDLGLFSNAREDAVAAR